MFIYSEVAERLSEFQSMSCGDKGRTSWMHHVRVSRANVTYKFDASRTSVTYELDASGTSVSRADISRASGQGTQLLFHL